MKMVRKTLVKLTPWFNFINVLRTTFTLIDPESVKNTVSHQYLFMPSGSTSAKAVRRTLVKLTPDVSTCIRISIKETMNE
jgi:hypothetical protein